MAIRLHRAVVASRHDGENLLIRSEICLCIDCAKMFDHTKYLQKPTYALAVFIQKHVQ